MRYELTLLVMTPLLVAACNSITGTQGANPPVVNVPIKNCLEEFRAVNILQPAEGSTFDSGACQHIVWEVLEFCEDWIIRIDVYVYDVLVNVFRHPWWIMDLQEVEMCLGNHYAGRTLTVKVTVWDALGEVSDTHTCPIVGSRPGVLQQRD